jgi:peptide/nickel transport system substrate-binding protein
MGAETTQRELSREEFLRGTAGLVAAGTGMGLLVPSAFASSEIKKGGILVYAYTDTSAAETTDPTVQTGIAVSQPPLQNSYERLTYVVPNVWKVLPQLAVSWEATPDATTWTFKLRKGVKFHNGKPLDSKDVKWSFSHILDPKNGSSAYARLVDELDPSGIKTPSADTVVFHLKKPDAQFPIFAGQYQAGIYPAGTDPKKTPFGTGPFMIKSWAPTQGWELVRNPHYWRPGIPYLDGVRGIYIVDPNTKVQAVVNGSAGITDTVNGTQIGSLKSNPNVRLYVLAGGISPDYSFDATQDPFTDPRVAQAIKIAVNRGTLLQAGFQGYGSLVGDVPELTIDPYYPTTRGVPTQNVAKAKALLQAAGKTDVSFTLTTADVLAGEVDMATALAQVVAPAGIHITIDKFPTDTFWSDAWLKKPAFTSWWNHRHPREILSLLYRSGAKWNESKFNSPSVDKLMDAGAATLNPAKQRAIFRQALNEVALNSGVGIAYFQNVAHVAKKNVNGVRADPVYHLILDKAWLG